MNDKQKLQVAEKQLAAAKGILEVEIEKYIALKAEQEKHIEFLDSVIETLVQERERLKASVSALEESVSRLRTAQ